MVILQVLFQYTWKFNWYVIEYNRKNCENRYANIAKALNLKGSNDSELTDALISKINEMNLILNIPCSMKEYGIDEKDFKDNLAFIAHNAVLDACTGSNPRPIDDSTMEKLFECTYYGTKVNL